MLFYKLAIIIGVSVLTLSSFLLALAALSIIIAVLRRCRA